MKKENIKKSLVSTRAKVWFVINLFCSILYLIWRIFFTIPIGYGVVSVVAGVSLLIIEALGLVEALVHFINMYNTHAYEKPDVPLEMFPDVDIFVATYNEEPELLEKTLLGCKRMDYPDLNKVHIYLCDDGKRESMRKLANRLGVNYLDREDHKGQKAGNLNNALKHSSSPYVVTFDSDMIPQSSFLMETIPYFVDAEIRNQGKEEKDKIKLGFLQTPQSFYDLDLFQFNLHSEAKIPNEQDYFYRDIEVARTRTNSCIYGGSNTVLSREALEAVGGFYTEAITEDFATGILIQKAGYVSLGIDRQLASGVSAKTLQELVQQRVRWGRGVISTGRKMHIYTSKDLSFGQKINYWASIWYWYAPIKRFCYIISPILYATFGFMVFRCTLPQVLIFWLPMYITSNICLRMLSNNIRNTKWTAIYEYALFPYMLIPIVLETFGISLTKFKVTNKGGNVENDKGKNLVYMIPLVILILLSIIGIIRCIITIFISGSLGPVVVLFWLIYNLYSMFMCFFFVDGRDIYRGAERVYVEVEGTLFIDDKQYEVVTKDISESGVALYLEKPILIENGANHVNILELRDRKWKTRLKVDIKHTEEQPKREEKKWLYTFAIMGYDAPKAYDQLLAILYDRVATNPTEIKKSNSIYDDLSTNISQRVVTAQYLKRQYPRIHVNCLIPVIANGETSKSEVIDFNYQYFATKSPCAIEKVEVVKTKAEGDAKSDGEAATEEKTKTEERIVKEVTFVIGDYKIRAEYERKEQRSYLYKVIDFEKIYFDEHLRDQIMEALLAIIADSKNNPAETVKEEVVEETSEQKQDKFEEMDML